MPAFPFPGRSFGLGGKRIGGSSPSMLRVARRIGCLLFTIDFDRNTGVEPLERPAVFLLEIRASDDRALWFFLQGPDVCADDADDPIRWATEWPAIQILTRAGPAEPIQTGNGLTPERVSDIARNTQSILA